MSTTLKHKHFFSTKVTSLKIIIVAAFIGLASVILLTGIIPIISTNSLPPEFQLLKGTIFHPDSIIIIQAINDPAKRTKPIILEIDSVILPKTVMPIEADDNFLWRILLKDLDVPDSLCGDGFHNIRFGFSHKKMSGTHQIYFDSKIPQFFGRIKSFHTGEKQISGTIIDDNQIEDQTITVEMTFRQQGQLHTISPPLNKKIAASGNKIYQFEYRFQNLPRISKKDRNYNQPFFSLKISDMAGNKFYREFTYNSFMADGVKKFGAAVIQQRIEKEKAAGLKLATQLTDTTSCLKTKSDSTYITLQLEEKTHKYVRLAWNRLPDSLYSAPEEYTILRENQPIATSFDNKYTDYAVRKGSTYKYQVLTRNKFYTSKVISVSIPSTIFINADCNELISERNVYNEAHIASIYDKLVRWIKKHPCKPQGIVNDLMNYKKGDFTFTTKFYYNESLYELFILHKRTKYDFTFFLTNLENNEAILINYLDLSKKTNYFKKGEISIDSKGRIIEFTGKEYPPVADATSFYYCIILNWWYNADKNQSDQETLR